MGLDHGLVRDEHRYPTNEDDGAAWDAYYDGKRASEVITWRKENAIHAWFVREVQNGVDECQNHTVTFDQLRRFVDTLDEVLEHRDKASEVLPTQAGFFFGSTSYDDWYWRGLEEARAALAEELAQATPESTWTYWSSW